MAASVYRSDTSKIDFSYVDQALQAERRDLAKVLILATVTLLLFTTALWGFSPKVANNNEPTRHR